MMIPARQRISSALFLVIKAEVSILLASSTTVPLMTNFTPEPLLLRSKQASVGQNIPFIPALASASRVSHNGHRYAFLLLGSNTKRLSPAQAVSPTQYRP